MFCEERPQLSGGDGQRILFIFDKAYLPGRDLFSQGELEDFAFFQGVPGGYFRYVTDSQIVFYHREDLVSGSCLEFRAERQAVAAVEVFVGSESHRILSQTYERMGGKFRQCYRFSLKSAVGRTSDQDISEREERVRVEGSFYIRRGSYYGQIHFPLSGRLDCLGGQMV